VSEKVVFERLRQLRLNTAPGPDDIPARILSQCAAAITPSLTLLFNLSLSTGEIPNDWKRANIVPIFKSGTKTNIDNYRPVALTSIVCKLLEKLISQPILNHLQNHNVINRHQHGFLPKRSCTTMLSKLIEDWQHCLDTKSVKQVDVVSLDFSKAFDMVPHGRLLGKLSDYGIKGNLLHWCESFLTMRTQCVVQSGSRSEPVDVTSGVPQGSVLGPLFFIIYMMDLPLCVQSKIEMYADDCTL
jgi:Reverse transcriptase (RNA-dependent DNA polymerase)